MRCRTFAVALVLGFPGCSGREGSDDRATSVRASLDSLLALHAQHFVSADIEDVIGVYTDSAVVRSAGMAPMRGHAAMRPAVAAWLAAAPIKTIAYTTEDLAVFGDTAFQITSFKGIVQPPGSAEMPAQGSCALLWVHEAQHGWKIARSLCNSGAPLAESPTP